MSEFYIVLCHPLAFNYITNFRYIGYYARLLKSPATYAPIKLYLRSVVLKPVPYFGGSNEFYLQVGP